MKFSTFCNLLLEASTKDFIPLKFIETGKDKKGNITGKWVNLDGSLPPAHVRKVFISKDLKNVKYNPDPKGKGIISAKDSKGRGIIKYKKTAVKKAAKDKFKRVQKLDTKLSDAKIEKVYTQMVKSDIAKCLALVMNTALRIGGDNDTKTDYKAYGASNLEARHIIVSGNKVSLDFIGKKNIHQNIPVNNSLIAKMLIDLKKKAKTPDTRIFSEDVKESKVLAYMKKTFGTKFKIHDIRTLMGTRIAIDEINKRPVPETKKDYKIAVKEVAAVVAEKLGNLATTALTSYINPLVFRDWQEALGIVIKEFVSTEKYPIELSLQDPDSDEYETVLEKDFKEVDSTEDDSKIDNELDKNYPELDNAEIGEVTNTLVDLLGFSP